MTTDIDDLLNAWTGAERTGDAATLDTSSPTTSSASAPSASCSTSPPWLGRFDHGLRYEQLELDELSIRRHGDAALVVAHQHAVGDAAATPSHPTPGSRSPSSPTTTVCRDRRDAVQLHRPAAGSPTMTAAVQPRASYRPRSLRGCRRVLFDHSPSQSDPRHVRGRIRCSSSPRSDEAQHQPHQLLVARRTAAARRTRARPRPQVDEAGIDTLWVADHLLQMDPNATVDEPMLEAYTTLGFLAATTRRCSSARWSPGRRSARRRCWSRS